MGENKVNKLFTIGVYGFSENLFFDSLSNFQIDIFIDLRQRRGVRGAKYSFVNSLQLQEKLKAKGIDYIYLKELAPTNEIRQLQQNADRSAGIKKKDRKYLGEVFRKSYREKILAKFNLEIEFNKSKYKDKKIVLFCVEEFPEACHRSLVSRRLQFLFDIEVEDILP